MKPKLKPETIKLLRQIKKKILAEPRQFAMQGFFLDSVENRTIPNCHTAACIGGWGIVIAKYRNPKEADNATNDLFLGADDKYHPIFIEANNVLGLNLKQSNALFLEEKWPTQFRKPKLADFDTTNTPAHNARLAARRIEHFIKTGK